MTKSYSVPSITIQRGVYAITPDISDNKKLYAIVEEVLSAGVRILQYRNKQANVAQQHEQAFELAALCQQYATCFIVNDNKDLAIKVGATGVHLGRNDLGWPFAKEQGLLVGVSCYNEIARAEEALSADYVAFGSFFASQIKPNAICAPLSCLDWRRKSPRPLVAAIGGITCQHIPQLLEAGADLLCGITDLFMNNSPYKQAHAWIECIKEYDNGKHGKA